MTLEPNNNLNLNSRSNEARAVAYNIQTTSPDMPLDLLEYVNKQSNIKTRTLQINILVSN